MILLMKSQEGKSENPYRRPGIRSRTSGSSKRATALSTRRVTAETDAMRAAAKGSIIVAETMSKDTGPMIIVVESAMRAADGGLPRYRPGRRSFSDTTSGVL